MRRTKRQRIPKMQVTDIHKAYLAQRGNPIEAFDPRGGVSCRQVGPLSRAVLAELRAAWLVLGPGIMAEYAAHPAPPTITPRLLPTASPAMQALAARCARRVAEHHFNLPPLGLRLFGPPETAGRAAR